MTAFWANFCRSLAARRARDRKCAPASPNPHHPLHVGFVCVAGSSGEIKFKRRMSEPATKSAPFMTNALPAGRPGQGQIGPRSSLVLADDDRPCTIQATQRLSTRGDHWARRRSPNGGLHWAKCGVRADQRGPSPKKMSSTSPGRCLSAGALTRSRAARLDDAPRAPEHEIEPPLIYRVADGSLRE